ncbi:hypothetical protein A1O3_05950 [Capronia epimyces CBS 606.96]|uniref:Uncharacterized protein n=1 Tax=Capronia epimyces CBS 606.96 TaxID=1182542 RepID=W9Y6L5_9EURO|nr:uncharacterized protein A1O3_05950 [Capronia epimyces CBS 606.96]EXJ85275.1 hypothetical protein A1O3_05950 [Capronia epimyces CBS 606.96]
MQSRVVQVLLLILSFVLALFLLIASSKYASWAKGMTVATGSWLPLVFYVGTIPLVSLVYTTVHLAALQFNGLPVPPYADPENHGGGGDDDGKSSPPRDAPYDTDDGVKSTMFILGISVLHLVAWLAQSILCTSCELAPVLAGTEGRVPRWCPQSRFKDTGQPGLAGMLGTLATVKDFLQWAMVLLTILLLECARREYVRAARAKHAVVHAAGAGVDFGGPSRGFGVPVPDWKTPGVAVELSTITISGPESGQGLGQGTGPRPFGLDPHGRRPQEPPQQPGPVRDDESRQTGRGRTQPGPEPHQQPKPSLRRTPTQTQPQIQVPGQVPGQVSGQVPGRKRLPPLLPIAPVATGSRDNNYGNNDAEMGIGTGTGTGTGLKRTGTLNYMYESRV